MKIIGHIKTDFPEKFGLPRQSGLVEGLTGEIILLPEYRNPDAFRGIDGFSHLWIIWQFSEALRDGFSPTVRPPRLGGNVRMGVFATRSPFRPNPIGLSCVKNCGVKITAEGPVLCVSGIDMKDGTPIYDIKPYLPIADCKVEATGGFSDERASYALSVIFPEHLASLLTEKERANLTELLAEDPRPAYNDDPERVYGFTYANKEIKFSVNGDTLTVLDIIKK